MFSKKQLLIYAGELVVIIVGILIAFQVEEWREGLQQERELQASLMRLKEETEFNLEFCTRSIPNASRKADTALHILNVIQKGSLEPADVEQFNDGLTRLAGMYKPPYISTAAEEMIATGLLKELEDSELRIRVAGLPGLVGRVSSDYSDQRQALNTTMNELAQRVEFHYEGSFDFETVRNPAELDDGFEQSIRVEYDFEVLAQDRYFRNLLIEAADTFNDLYLVQHSFCAATQEVDALLVKSGVN
jgi:hypothetical protein